MKGDFKDSPNSGTKDADLSRGYIALSDDVPISGESITKPEHVAMQAKMQAMYPGMDDEMQEEDGGFLERACVPYRTNRTDEIDRG